MERHADTMNTLFLRYHAENLIKIHWDHFKKDWLCWKEISWEILSYFFPLSCKLSLTTITSADVQDNSITEISTGKDAESSRDLAKTVPYSIFLPSFFPKLHLKYAVQGGFARNSSETSSHLNTSSSVSPGSATQNDTVFMCLIKTFFAPTVQHLYSS